MQTEYDPNIFKYNIGEKIDYIGKNKENKDWINCTIVSLGLLDNNPKYPYYKVTCENYGDDIGCLFEIEVALSKNSP